MKKFANSRHDRQSCCHWQTDFEAMLPRIELAAKIAFRHLDPDAREEAVQETVCNACQAYARLAGLGKTGAARPSALARFGILQTKMGRKVGCRLNGCDVLSGYCRRKRNLAVERLDRYDPSEEALAEMLTEDKHAGPAETAIVRMDFAAWLRLLPRRLRKIAAFLARGETTSDAAKRFRVSPGRIAQIRRELFEAWRRFQGEASVWAVAR